MLRYTEQSGGNVVAERKSLPKAPPIQIQEAWCFFPETHHTTMKYGVFQQFPLNRSMKPCNRISILSACFCLAIHIPSHSLVQALSSSSSSSTPASEVSGPTTLRICQGSSCMGKCRGSFDPKKSFEGILSANQDETTAIIHIEEAFCLNQCKRGPNARLLQGDKVVVFSSMTETEQSRKSFQSISTDMRVEKIAQLAMDFATGNLPETDEDGNPTHQLKSTKTLGDILPTKL